MAMGFDLGYGRAMGRVKVKTEPWPSWLVTAMVPPCAVTMARAMARPMPVPLMRLGRDGSR